LKRASTSQRYNERLEIQLNFYSTGSKKVDMFRLLHGE
jgi:hypothetical protein